MRRGWISTLVAAGLAAALAGATAHAAAPSPPSGAVPPAATPAAPPSAPPATTPATPAPVAAVRAGSTAVAGRSLLLDGSGSTPVTALRSFAWTVTGTTGTVRTLTAAPLTTVRLAAPGPIRVTLRVTDADGRTAERTLALVVAPAPHAVTVKATAATSAPRAPRARTAAAGDPLVTIKDFSFGPANVTIHVGDTVTWTNAGPTEHTATASDRSFDTGILQKGKSASHTFRKAGTFAYICTLHPFMKARVTVLAAASSTPATTPTTPAAPSTTTPSATPAASPAPTGPTLPVTGGDPLAVTLAGAGLLGAGLTLRRRAAGRGAARPTSQAG